MNVNNVLKIQCNVLKIQCTVKDMLIVGSSLIGVIFIAGMILIFVKPYL